jgi:predicted HTH transcriptional regulator
VSRSCCGFGFRTLPLPNHRPKLPRQNMDEDDPFVRVIRQRAEARDVEYKESQTFEGLKWRLVKTCMAMANLQDGGYIIIGISEREQGPELDGISDEHLPTYQQDELLEMVNRYARPPVSLLLRVVEHDGRRFVGIRIESFTRIPVLCHKAMPNDAGKDALKPGQIVARTLERISTSRVVDADLMAEILEVAIVKRAAEFISLAQRAGFGVPPGGADRYAQERASFGDFES